MCNNRISYPSTGQIQWVKIIKATGTKFWDWPKKFTSTKLWNQSYQWGLTINSLHFSQWTVNCGKNGNQKKSELKVEIISSRAKYVFFWFLWNMLNQYFEWRRSHGEDIEWQPPRDLGEANLIRMSCYCPKERVNQHLIHGTHMCPKDTTVASHLVHCN